MLQRRQTSAGDLLIFLASRTTDADSADQLIATLDGQGTLLRDDLAIFHMHQGAHRLREYLS